MSAHGDDSVFLHPQAIKLGLTKRELFAAMALQGLLTSPEGSGPAEDARGAVRYADALIAELAKKQS